MLSSPLAAIGTVIKQKSTESMPFAISLAMFFNSLSWFLYAFFVILDLFIWIPNLLGLVASIIQLLLFVIFPSTRRNNAVAEAPNEMTEVASLTPPRPTQSDSGVAV